jgi:hypothetical protein
MSQSKSEPIHLIEDQDTGDRFLVYGSEMGARLDIRFAGETLWMSQAQISDLFGRDQSVISRHILNIFEEGELDPDISMQKVHRSQGRPTTIYNLDLVISVGYRVSSAQATAFRRWATGILVQYAKKGFVVDSARLKNPENADRIKELREIIRDIRADEANLYREFQQICAMCADYDPKSDASLEFFRNAQAKFIHGVVSLTPSEILIERADATKPDMGLTNWPNDNIRKPDVIVSKNYLADAEIRELNRITSIILDVFEDQFDVGRITTMSEARAVLDKQLDNLGRVVLSGGGSVSTRAAHAHANAEYEKYKEAKKIARHKQADEAIARLAREAKALKRPKR